MKWLEHINWYEIFDFRSSYAINIAKQVGLPDKVTSRASEILKIINENLDTDKSLSDETDKISKLDLLYTETSRRQFNE